MGRSYGVNEMLIYFDALNAAPGPVAKSSSGGFKD